MRASIAKIIHASVAKAKEAIEGLRRRAVEADAYAKKLEAEQYQKVGAFIRAELEGEGENFLSKASGGAKGVHNSYLRMVGLNVVLKQLA